MKATVEECEGCFDISLEAETVEEAVILVRMGVNHVKELRHVGTDADQDGSLSSYVVVGKRTRVTSAVPQAK